MGLSDTNRTDQDDITLTSDKLNFGGVDTVLNLTTAPVEGKVGASVLEKRKYFIMQALDKNVKWGFSNSTQSFDLFKNQLIMIGIGEGTQIWFKTSTGTSSVAIAEIA